MNHLPIRSLQITQFRGFRNLDLSGFASVNLMVGPNNAGKTSILDAIALFSRPLDIANWREIARGREVKSARTPESEPFKWLFPQSLSETGPSPHRIWITGEGHYTGRRILAEYEEFQEFGAAPDDSETLPLPDFPQETASGLRIRALADYATHPDLLDADRTRQNEVVFNIVDNRRNVFPTGVSQPYLDLALISPHTHRTTQDTSWYLSRAIQKESIHENYRESVLEILRRIDPEVLDLSIVETGKTTTSILIKHRRTGQTPIHAFGDGFRRALLIAATIPSVRNGILLIDEIEAALHVSALNSVMEGLRSAAKQFNVQVFATTHSLEAVDAILDVFGESEGDLTAFRLERADGAVSATSYPGHLLRETRYEMGFEIR